MYISTSKFTRKGKIIKLFKKKVYSVWNQNLIDYHLTTLLHGRWKEIYYNIKSAKSIENFWFELYTVFKVASAYKINI